MKPNAKITDVTLDSANLNKHTERGTYMTGKSIDKFQGSFGAGVLDANNIVLDANLRTELFAERGINDIIIIDAKPDTPIYIRYDVLDLTDSDNPARELQLALHQSAIHSYDVDAEMLYTHRMENEALTDDWMFESELIETLSSIGDELDNLASDLASVDDVVVGNVCDCCGGKLK